MKVIELRAELQARGLDTKGDCLDVASNEKIIFLLLNNRSESRAH